MVEGAPRASTAAAKERHDLHSPARLGARDVVPPGPHPASWLFTAIAALGVVLVATNTSIVLGAVMALLGVYMRHVAASAQLANAAYNQIGLGRLAAADHLLDLAERASGAPHVRLAIAGRRAAVALRRGDLRSAMEHADRAIEGRRGLIARSHAALHQHMAQAIRALVRASAGDEAGARADIAAVRAGADSPPETLARCAVAEAILIERSADRAALRAHLQRHRALLFEASDRRDRAIVRAYQRLLEAAPASAYRKPAEEAPAGGDAPPVAEWVARIAPGAAPFATPRRGEARRLALATLPPPPDHESAELGRDPGRSGRGGRARPEQGRSGRTGRRIARTAKLVAGVVTLFALPTILPVGARMGGMGSEASDALAVALTLVVPLALVAWTLRRVLAVAADTRRVASAAAAAFTSAGGDPGPVADLERLAQRAYAPVAAQARLHLAARAARTGDWSTALAHADAGLAEIGGVLGRMGTAELAAPALMGERALALAALDRHVEAESQLASLASSHPAHVFLARDQLRARLMSAVRSGDLAAAAALAERASPDLPLGAREELLADLVCAAHRPEAAGAGEIERIKRELRDEPALRAWLERTAPAALDAFWRAVEAEAPAESAALDAEAEAIAEAEDDAGSEETRPRRERCAV